MSDRISKNMLTLSEVRDAVAAASRLWGGKLDMVGFDACLMSNLENAVMLSPYAQYLVASEEAEPDGGWDYTFLNLFSDRSKSGSVTAVDIGQAIVDGYATTLTKDGKWESNVTLGTLALTDLSRIGAVETAYEALSAALLKLIKDDLAKGETAPYVDLIRVGETVQSMFSGFGMIDLYDFVYRVGQAFPSLSAQVNTVIAALGSPPGSDAADYQGKVGAKDYVGRTLGDNPAVLYRGVGYLYNNCLGLSVYFPLADSMIPVEKAETVYANLNLDSYLELFSQKYLDSAGVPVFDGNLETESTEEAFTLNFSSAEAAKSVKQVEYVTTYTELDGEDLKTFLLGSELITEGWQDGSYSQVPYEDWYALGEHFITVEPVGFEAKSETAEHDTYAYKIYAAVGDNYGQETLAELQVSRSAAPGVASGTGMTLAGASAVMEEGDEEAARALMPEDIAYIRPAVAEYDLESHQITGYKVYDEKVQLKEGDTVEANSQDEAEELAAEEAPFPWADYCETHEED